MDRKKALKVFLISAFCVAMLEGLSINIFSNYLKEVYHVSDQVRGFIETPREFPGILAMFLIPLLTAVPDLRIASLATAVAGIGMICMGVLSPKFGFMVFLMFMYSFGTHTYYPLEASISLNLAGDSDDLGHVLGQVKRSSTAAYFVAAVMIFVFFRTGFFSFQTKIIKPFLFASVFAFGSSFCLYKLSKSVEIPKMKQQKFLVKKKYTPYYLLTFAFGMQKRIRIVFALWVFTQILGKKADFTAILLIASAVCGLFLSTKLGALIDKKGAAKTMKFEAAYMFVTFVLYGLLARGLNRGTLEFKGIIVPFMVVLFIAADLTRYFDLVHSYVLRSIVDEPSDITASLSTGQAIDHAISIVVSPIFGVMWAKFGPESVFWFVALTTAIQLFVSKNFKPSAQAE